MRSDGAAQCRPFAIRILRMVLPLVVVAVSLLHTTDAHPVRWYAGNKRDDAYGVQAYVWTPASYPYIETLGSCSWVSTCGPNWLQAGWEFWQGWSYIGRYVEHYINGYYRSDPWGTQNLSSSSHYKVDYGGLSTWWAFIDGDNKGGFGPIYAPLQVQALSEVHESSNNTLNTLFELVEYKDGSSVYRDLDTPNWSEDSPYKVDKYNYYSYRSWAP